MQGKVVDPIICQFCKNQIDLNKLLPYRINGCFACWNCKKEFKVENEIKIIWKEKNR